MIINIKLTVNFVVFYRAEDNQDKLYKVRPLLDMLSEKFASAYYPDQNLSLDESMIPWRGLPPPTIQIKTSPWMNP